MLLWAPGREERELLLLDASDRADRSHFERPGSGWLSLQRLGGVNWTLHNVDSSHTLSSRPGVSPNSKQK